MLNVMFAPLAGGSNSSDPPVSGLRLFSAGLVSVLAMLGSVACASKPEVKEPPLDNVLVVRSPSDVVLPLDAYQQTVEQQKLEIRAQQLLVQKCARRYGIDVALFPFDVVDTKVANERRYGIILESDAVEWGYRPPPRMTESKIKDKKGGWDPVGDEFVVVSGTDQMTHESREGVVVNGVPIVKDGCAGEAERLLNTDVTVSADMLLLAETLAGDSFSRAENDSRTQKAFAEWSGCMRIAGFAYRNPFEANDHPFGDKVTQEEISQAVADVRCRQQHNVVGVWLAVESAYQKQIIEKNAERLRDAQQALEKRLSNAAKALSS